MAQRATNRVNKGVEVPKRASYPRIAGFFGRAPILWRPVCRLAHLREAVRVIEPHAGSLDDVRASGNPSWKDRFQERVTVDPLRACGGRGAVGASGRCLASRTSACRAWSERCGSNRHAFPGAGLAAAAGAVPLCLGRLTGDPVRATAMSAHRSRPRERPAALRTGEGSSDRGVCRHRSLTRLRGACRRAAFRSICLPSCSRHVP